MKKAILFAIVAVVVLLAVGCEKTFSTTYYEGEEGQYCYQITVSSGVVKTALEAAGWDEAECTTTDLYGTCTNDTTWGGETVEQAEYYYDDYWTYSIDDECDGTWESAS